MVGTQSFMTTMCGTPAYVAPEILYGEQYGYGEHVDTWSLGCVLFFMVSATMAFTGKDMNAIKNGLFYFVPAPNWEKVSVAAKELIKQLIVVCPEERISLENVSEAGWYKHESLMAGKRKFIKSPRKSKKLMPRKNYII